MAPALRPASAIAAFIAALVAATAGAAPPEVTTVATRGAIAALALDGPWLGYALHAPSGCATVHVRDVRTGRDVVVSGRRTCGADSTSTGAGIRELALAGRRAAWIVSLGGNTEAQETLYTARSDRPGDHLVASARRFGDADGAQVGSWLGGLAGDGGLIAVNRWTTAGGAVVAASLRRLEGGLPIVAAGPATLDLAAVGGARLGLLRRDGTVAVLDRSGRVVSSFVPIGPPREVALGQGLVAVLETGQLEVRLAASGRLLRTLPVPRGARFLDLHAGIATVAVGRRIVAVRLDDGRQATVATAPRAVRAVQLDGASLVYAFDRTTGVHGAGTVVVVPIALVQHALR